MFSDAVKSLFKKVKFIHMEIKQAYILKSKLKQYVLLVKTLGPTDQ